ncbi:MAG: glycosyltransferase [Abditibacteriota bacterium]|nr:glycosyltransferase [Abditibacteriota bacterium]
MKILFLAQIFPYPPDSGGKICSYHTLKALSEEHEVCLVSYTRSDKEIESVGELEKLCAEVKTVPMERSKLTNPKDALLSLINGKSFIISRDYRDSMQKLFDETVKTFKPDAVHIDHLQMAQFVDFNASYKAVLYNHNVEYMIIKRIAETAKSPATKLFASQEYKKLRKFELDACRKSDLVITVSDEDKKTLSALVPEAVIQGVPIAVDTDYFTPVDAFPGTDTLFSIGTMHWPPNVDAAHYFVDEIFDLVLEKHPKARYVIAGQKPVPSIVELGKRENIDVTGYVEDSREAAKCCDVFIVPLRSGSGMRVKILNACAMGLAVVSTTVGAEGIDCVPGEHYLQADTPAEFAAAVCKLLDDGEYAKTIGKNAYDFVKNNYSREIINKKIRALYADYIEKDSEE